MTANEIFKKWMDSIPNGMFKDIKTRVIDDCKINNYTYGNWRSGNCQIPPLAQEKIEAISIDLYTQNIGFVINFNTSDNEKK